MQKLPLVCFRFFFARVYVTSAAILPCGAPPAELVPVLGSEDTNHRWAPSFMWKWITELLWGTLQWLGLPPFLKDYWGRVVVVQPPMAQSELHSPQTGNTVACSSGRPNLLYSAFALLKKKSFFQPPPVCFSLFLCLFLSLPLSTPSPPSPTPPLLPALLECKAFYGGVHNNSCNSPAPACPPRGPAWPEGSVSGSHVFGWKDWNPHLLSPTPWCHHTIASFAFPFLFLASLLPPEPNPHIGLLCPHSSRTACPGSEMGHGRWEKRREKPCLELAFTLMIYEYPPPPLPSPLSLLPVYPSGFGLQWGNAEQQEGSCCGADNEWSMYDVIPLGSFHSAVM